MATTTSARRPNATVGSRKARKPGARNPIFEDPAWLELQRLAAGVRLSSLGLVQQRFEDEVARCEAAGVALVALERARIGIHDERDD